MRISGLRYFHGAKRRLTLAKASIGRRRWTSTDAQSTKPEWLYWPSETYITVSMPRRAAEILPVSDSSLIRVFANDQPSPAKLSPDRAPRFSDCDNRGLGLTFGNGSVDGISIVAVRGTSWISQYSIHSPCRLNRKYAMWLRQSRTWKQRILPLNRRFRLLKRKYATVMRLPVARLAVSRTVIDVEKT